MVVSVWRGTSHAAQRQAAPFPWPPWLFKAAGPAAASASAAGAAPAAAASAHPRHLQPWREYHVWGTTAPSLVF